MNSCFDFITIDFETANDDYNSACSIGLVAVKNNNIAETFYSLIKPEPLKFNEKNIEIHGITHEDVKDAPTFYDIWNKIKNYFDGNIIVAHNAIFDMSVLKNCLFYYNLGMPNFEYLCSIPISTRACRGEKIGKSLKDRTEYFNIEINDHHNALSDATACAELVLACIKKQHHKSFESYCSTYTSLPIKLFEDLIPQRKFGKESPRFNRVSVSDIVALTDSFDTSHILYGKNIVFTGDLETLDRKTAMQKVVDLGAIIKSGVSKTTDYLIAGVQDKSLVGDAGMSTKEQKVYDLIEKGYDIKILSEYNFLKLLNTEFDNTLNSMIIFDNTNEKIDKLKEWKLLSPKADELKDIYYKDKSDTYKCEVIGYFSRKTNSNCLDRSYETIAIKVNNNIIKIAPAYLFDMQKKDFSFLSQSNEITE
ncbi:MAG: exonuclease domain-containing protein [Clostridiaceae bacterium]